MGLSSVRRALAALEDLDEEVAEYLVSSLEDAAEDSGEPMDGGGVLEVIEPFVEGIGLEEEEIRALASQIAALLTADDEQEPDQPPRSPREEAQSAQKQRCDKLNMPAAEPEPEPGTPRQNLPPARDGPVERRRESGGNERRRGRNRRGGRGGRNCGRRRGKSNGHPLADSPARVAAESEPEPEPEPALLEAISTEDQEQQQEEAELLESIFGNEVFHRCGPHEWEIDVEVACPASVTVEWILGEGKELVTNTFMVKHLPPLTLAIERSPGYPSQRPPQFTLRCHCESPPSLRC